MSYLNMYINDLIVYLKDKLKNLGIPEDTEPGAGDVEEGYLEELAEAKDTNASVLGAEELDNEVDAFDGDQGKLGGIEEADGHLVLQPLQWSVHLSKSDKIFLASLVW